MSDFVTPYLFNAHALPVDTDEPHARHGNHLRVNHHPLLGLPVAPFLVARAEIDNLKLLNTRSDARFYDRNDNELLPPFDVTPDNPVTAVITLAPRETCIWAQVEALSVEDSKPREQPDSPPPVTDAEPIPFNPILPRPGVVRPGGSRPMPPNNPFDDIGRITRRPSPLFNRERFRVPNIDPDLLRRNRRLTCEAFVDSAAGPATIGRRSERRYAFSGPGITQIRITGWGRVTRVRWIEARDEQRLEYEPCTIMNLPHEGGARYLPIHDALARADQRVAQQAPKRRPLQETLDTPAPAAAPLADATFEQQRVASLSATAVADLEPLINDLSQSQREQVVDEAFVDEHGNNVGSSTASRLGRVLQMLADPGTASRLGYKWRDDAYKESDERVVFYRVFGFFADPPPSGPLDQRPPEETLVDGMIDSLRPQHRNWSRQELLQALASLLGHSGDDAPLTHATARTPLAGVNAEALDKLEDHDRYFGVSSIAIADRGAPLDPLRPPQLPPPEETPPLRDNWLPATPPAARREVIVDVRKSRVGGLLAAGKRTPAAAPGAVYRPLNKANGDGFHLPLVLALNSDDGTQPPEPEPGSGFVADRQAGPEAIRYFIAEQDRFGRWSNWARREHRAGVRPRPPRPEFQAYYRQPAIEDAASNGGSVLVKVMVPDAESLAPGSHLLQTLRLFRVDEVDGTLAPLEAAEADKQLHPADAGAPADERRFLLDLRWTGPVLAATEQRTLRLTARWIDTEGRQSEESTPTTLRLVDPRPPAPVPVPDELQYAARPDVTGLCWVEYRWHPQPGQHHFGVYYSDENRLRSHLDDLDRHDLLDDLDAAADAAARATIFRANEALFPDFLFERLREVNVAFNSGERGFRHPVSGSLRILNFYKVAAEAESGAKPVLTDVPMIVYGVPNADPPPRPTVQVTPVSAEAGENPLVAQVQINLLTGTTKGLNWRLRRSSVSTQTLARVPVVATGAMGEIDEATGRQQSVYRDDGPVQIAPHAQLRPWVRYSWVAEVQGAPESGSEAAGQAVPGLWSRPSDPFSLVLLPEQPPAPPSIDDVQGQTVGSDRRQVQITFSHPDELSGGSVGSYRLRLSRRLASDAPLELLRDEAIGGSGPFVVSDEASDSTPVPVGTEYLVELVDPLGRASGPGLAVVT
ncbi:hypothetical protein [Halomonas nitroreducens]|uniref:Uncharacterized protein n=1 Tax=Halomonas nitroreducens TaxID=447425 RepID=A0A3S0K026_9GAMM|nr:hypothetical protein [Halomonas nitroreducens]RTR06886.1 hypothetical protein EKG36_00015 [Halomonas nitroreducens]